MTDFLKMDIFFVVATFAVIAVTIFATVVLWRLERVLKNIEYISKQIAMESDAVRQDIAEMRTSIREGKGRLKSLFTFLGTLTKRKSKRS